MILLEALSCAKLAGDFTTELRDNYIYAIRVPEERRGLAPDHNLPSSRRRQEQINTTRKRADMLTAIRVSHWT
jgi:hypothetical protein